MIRMRTTRIVLGALALAAWMVPGGLLAEEPEFEISLDPLVLEGLWLDQDTTSSKFQEYRDLSDGFRVRLGLQGLSDDFGRLLEVRIINGGKDDAFYGLEYDVAGRWSLELSYDNIPHRFGNDGKVLFTRNASQNAWEIQDPIQAALQAANEAQVAARQNINFAFLNSLIQPYLAVADTIDVGLQRRRTRANLELGKGGAASWNLEYRHEARTGTRNLGTSFGFNNVTELPEPIRYDTTDAILSGTWKWSQGIATAGYRHSRFENDVSTLFFDNPWRITDSTDPSAYSSPGFTVNPLTGTTSGSIGGARVGFFDLAPDNDMASFFANGRFDLTGRSWLQFSAAWTQFDQDDPLLPMTLNTAIVAPAQPFGSANREADMKRLAVNYGARYDGGWQLGVRYGYQDYSDDSPRYAWDGYVRFHAVLEEIARITVPVSWSRETITASLDKDLDEYGNLGLEIKRDTYEREFRETEETTEDLVALKWDARLGEAMVRANYEMGDRDFDGAYETEAQEASFVHPEGINNLPGLRKFDQAARKSDRWNVSVGLPVAEVWALTARLGGSKFDYDESEFGLTGDETVRYGVDLDRELGEGGSFFVWVERADRDVSQASRQSGATPSVNPLDNWFVDFAEVNDTLGIGWAKETKQWQARLSGEWVESDGEAEISSPPGGTPNLGFGFGNYEDYERLALSGKLDREITSKIAVGLSVLYEDYTIDSFIRQDLANYLPGALLIFADDGEYAAWSAALRLKLRF